MECQNTYKPCEDGFCLLRLRHKDSLRKRVVLERYPQPQISKILQVADFRLFVSSDNIVAVVLPELFRFFRIVVWVYVFVGTAVAVSPPVAVLGTEKQGVGKEQHSYGRGYYAEPFCNGVAHWDADNQNERYECRYEHKSGEKTRAPDVVHPAAEAGVVGDIEICADQRRYQVYVLVVSPFLLHRIAHAVDKCRSDDADKCGIPEFGAACPSAIAAVAFLDIQYIEQSLKKCHAGCCFHNLSGCFIDAMFVGSLAGYTFRKLLLCKFR